jgi:hypothetical protein
MAGNFPQLCTTLLGARPAEMVLKGGSRFREIPSTAILRGQDGGPPIRSVTAYPRATLNERSGHPCVMPSSRRGKVGRFSSC